MSDLADNTADCLPLERVPEDIDGKIDRQTYTLEQLAKWKAEAEKWKVKYEQLSAVYDQLVKGSGDNIQALILREQIIAIWKHRLPAPQADRWNFSREELNAAPIRFLEIQRTADGGAFVEL